jgi:transcriptional regulator with XRE-family HTH domain
MLTGAQIRAARGLLNMSVAELAERTGLAVNTIRKAEGTNEVPPITPAPMQLIIKIFTDAGVIFLEAGEQGVGVRFARPAKSKFQSRRRDK